MSEATFDNTMSDILLEINDREIYNDIRSEIDITETLTEEETEQISEAEYDKFSDWERGYLAAGASQNITFTTTKTQVTWLTVKVKPDESFLGLTEGECLALGGTYYPPYESFYSSACYVDITGFRARFVSRTGSSCVVQVTNNSNISTKFKIEVTYQSLKRAAEYYTNTQERITQTTLQVRATDETSIKKYGRRVLPLRWPLGQTQQQMQSLVEAYLERYKEPVPLLEMHIQGRTDEFITQIFERKISDQITVKNTELGLTSADFFINAISAEHNMFGLLECVWQLEQVRDMETASFFTLDVSELDGPDVLAW